jgi:hypothetical protein
VHIEINEYTIVLHHNKMYEVLHIDNNKNANNDDDYRISIKNIFYPKQKLHTADKESVISWKCGM